MHACIRHTTHYKTYVDCRGGGRILLFAAAGMPLLCTDGMCAETCAALFPTKIVGCISNDIYPRLLPPQQRSSLLLLLLLLLLLKKKIMLRSHTQNFCAACSRTRRSNREQSMPQKQQEQQPYTSTPVACNPYT